MPAGVWLGGVVFTPFLVSPALKAMEWGEAESDLVRSGIGKRYAKAESANLALFAVLDGLVNGFRALLYVECALLAVVAGLVAVHGAHFGSMLAQLATAEREAPGTRCRAPPSQPHGVVLLTTTVSSPAAYRRGMRIQRFFLNVT